MVISVAKKGEVIAKVKTQNSKVKNEIITVIKDMERKV